MGKATGFIDYPRELPPEREPKKRIGDWKEHNQAWPEEKWRQQGARCMDCGTPFCHTGIQYEGAALGCPLYNLIPEWNDLVYRGRWKEALSRLLKTNNFPEFTGRVCPAPCEGSCTVGIYDPPVAIKGIERMIVDKGFAEGWIVPSPPKKRTGKKAAVVGSGPAGLACADQLNKAGHSVTVFERADRIGGLLMYGIPNMKLEKEIVDRRIRLLQEEGIQFVTNTEVGKDILPEQLRSQYDAVILCTGAQNQRDLNIPGRELQGIHLAMEYLTLNTKSLLDSNLENGEYISAKGKDVIVIGGGDTGADCVATALRHGCRSIVQFGKHPKLPSERSAANPWPQFPQVFSLDYAYQEALEQTGKDPREYSVLTKRFSGDSNGQVQALHTVQMKKIIGEDGRADFQEIPGTEKTWPAQLVLIAVGFRGPEREVMDAFGLDYDNRCRVKASFGKYTTNIPGVFAAGDARRGQSLIVWAINEGRGAARECDRYLMGDTILP